MISRHLIAYLSLCFRSGFFNGGRDLDQNLLHVWRKLGDVFVDRGWGAFVLYNVNLLK